MSAAEHTLDEVARPDRARVRGEVLAFLRRDRRPRTSLDLALRLGCVYWPVQRAVCELLSRGDLADVGRTAGRRPLYRPVDIGTCEWCGVTSHELIAGECPQCRAKAVCREVGR